MKTLITLVVAFILVTTDSRGAGSGDNIFGHGKNKSLFVFRAKKKFAGATVEVYSSQGKLVTAQSIHKRKMIIDFGDVTKDIYTIRIVKGAETREYRFVKG